MLCGSVTVILLSDIRKRYILNKWDLLMLLAGALTCILSFIIDYLLVTRASRIQPAVSGEPLFTDIRNYVPQEFHYAVFFCGFVLMCAGILRNILITNKNNEDEKK
jgi:hypothetical protein